MPGLKSPCTSVVTGEVGACSRSHDRAISSSGSASNCTRRSSPSQWSTAAIAARLAGVVEHRAEAERRASRPGGCRRAGRTSRGPARPARRADGRRSAPSRRRCRARGPSPPPAGRARSPVGSSQRTRGAGIAVDSSARSTAPSIRRSVSSTLPGGSRRAMNAPSLVRPSARHRAWNTQFSRENPADVRCSPSICRSSSPSSSRQPGMEPGTDVAVHLPFDAHVGAPVRHGRW